MDKRLNQTLIFMAVICVMLDLIRYLGVAVSINIAMGFFISLSTLYFVVLVRKTPRSWFGAFLRCAIVANVLSALFVCGIEVVAISVLFFVVCYLMVYAFELCVAYYKNRRTK